MAGLAPPPPRDQVTARDGDRYELCGETCLASAFGLDIETVTGWLRQHEGGERAVHSGTGMGELMDFCRSRGATARIVRGPATQYVATAAGRGHYALVLVWSDHQGRPIPRAQSARLHAGGIGHWLLGYGATAATVQVMQPWGGRLTRYDLRGGQDQQTGIEIGRAVPSAPGRGPSPVSAPPRPAPAPGRPRVYVVRPGDTLSAIARAQHVTLPALLRANPQIKDPNRIAVGQRISLPG